MAHRTIKPEVGPMCRGRMYSGRWRSNGLRHTRVRPSLSHRQNLLSSLKKIGRHSTPQSTLSRHQSSRAWRYRGVSGNVIRSVGDLSLAVSRQFPMVLGDITGARCAQISYQDAVRSAIAARTMRPPWRMTVLHDRPEPGLRVWECSTDHCWKQQHTADTLCPTCAAIRRYFHLASRRPTLRPNSNGWSCSTGVRTRRRGICVP